MQHSGTRRHRRLALTALALLGAGAGWLGVEAASIDAAAAPYVHARATDLPPLQVGLLLGCSRLMPDGRVNEFFAQRVGAAAELMRLGKVSYLLVSGDNSRQSYDEPTDMRDALEAAGVARSRIVLDFAGFRTLDSVVRAKAVFGATRLVVISQHFHNVRAVYLARAHGIEAYGYDAPEVRGVGGAVTKLREVASRLFAVLDVKVFHTRPRYLGLPEPTPFRPR